MKIPVILVHGISDDSSKMEHMAHFLRHRGWTVYSISLKPSSGQIGIDQLAEQLNTFINEKITPTQKFDLIGFSMGGLVCRYYVQRITNPSHLDHFITLSSPHHGTLTAYLSRNKGARQMRINSEFLRDLNRDITKLNQLKFTSIWTPFDLMIIPSSSSRTGIGREIKIAALAHPLMVKNQKCLRAIETELLR